MELFGYVVPGWAVVLFVAVIVVALVYAVVLPMYKGYKKEMAKGTKKASSGKGAAAKKR